MSINDIINNKNNRDMVSAFKKMADGKPVNLSIQPSSVNMPDEMRVKVLNPTEEVTVKNLGDVLKSLGLLGVGLSELKDSLESLDLEKEINIEAGEINLGPVTKAIESLKSEIKSLPARTIAATPDIKFPKLEIPKEFKVKEIGDLKKGLVSINDNLVKLAGVVRESQPEINIPESDATDLISAVSSVEKAVKGIIFPLPPATTPAYKNTNQEAASAVLQADGSVPVTIIGGAGSGGTSAADDADFTPGSTAGTPAMGIYESSPTSVTDGDLGVAGITATRELKVSIEADNVGIGGGTQYTEDAVAAADPVGNASILVREDSPVSIAADGDNVALRGTQYGAAYSQIVDSSGNFVDSFGGGTQYAVDTALGATPTGTLAVGIRDDALSALTPVEGDAVGLRTDANGALWVIPSGTVTVDGSGVTQPVSGTITANLSATDNAVLDSIDTAVNGTLTVGSHDVTNAGTFAVQISDTSFAVADGNALGEGVLIQGDDGTDRKNINVDATTGDVQVDVTNTVTVDGSGVTQPVSGTVTANLSATDNTVLDNIDTNTTGLNNTVGTDGAAGPSSALSVAGTETGGNLQELRVDSDGHLQVDILSGGGSNASVVVDDAAFTVATDSVTAIGAMLDDTATDSVDEGDVGVVRMSSDRRLLVDAQIAGQDANVTVDGTVTANLSATDNAVLDSIDAAVNGTLTVGSHAVTNAGTFAVQVDGAALTALQLIDDPIATDDTTTHTAATTKVMGIGAVAAPTDTTVDANDIAMPAMSTDRRLHTDSQIVGQDAALDVSAATVTVDNGGTFATQVDGAALTALQLIDDSIFADDAAFTLASSKVTMSGAIRDDSLTTLTAVEGDAVPLRVNSTGALHVTGAGGGTQYNIDTALGATDTTTLAGVVRDDSLSTLTEADGDVTVLRVSSTGALHVTGGGGGTEYNEDVATPATITGTATLMERDDALTTVTPIEGDWIGFRGTAEGALWVQDFNSDAILADTANMDTNLGTIAGAVTGTEMQVDVITLPASTNTLEVVGDVAHDAAAAGNPVAIAGRATNNIEGLTQVANADATYLTTDLNGVAVTRPHTTLEEIVTERVTDTGGTSTAFTNFAAGGAGVHNYITTITIYNSSATDGYVDFRDGAAGSVLFTAPAPTVGGSVINLPVPLKTSANTALAYDVSAALSTVYISVVGFQAQG